ncbi:MAG: Mucin 2 precursor [Myxococcaceae bacterium]|nr:Mucin 2 precursor [Myxococcaceae bacterium]
MAKLRWPAIDPSHLSKLVGVVAAMAVIVLLNVVSARRFTRWDWTANKRYTLSTATTQTLHDLPDAVQVWVLLGGADPLEQSVKQLLVAYQAETTKLDIHYIDPDRDTVALEDIRKRFKIETGRTEDGHVVADAVVVVAHGDRHWFITAADMVEVAASDDTKVKPREERALTGAIRSVLGGTKTKVCFVTGHGEMSPSDPSERGAGVLKEVLDKDNYVVAIVSLGAPNAAKPLEGCAVAIIAGLLEPFEKTEAERLRTWLLEDGNLFVAASPILGGVDPTRPPGAAAPLVPAGLERVLGPFGIALDDDVVTEQEADVAMPASGGFRFVVQPRQHPVTTGLVKSERARDVPRVVVYLARSMRRAVEPGAVNAQELLATSASAFGLRSIEGAADWKDAPQKHPGDLAGPLSIAMAAERPKVSASSPHGPRVVVVGSSSVLSNEAFRDLPAYRGGPLFTESAISWLAAKPQVLDVPEKAPVGAGMRVDEESRGSIRRYVVLFMPATVALLGLAIALFRRAGEGRTSKDGKARERKDGKGRKKPG